MHELNSPTWPLVLAFAEAMEAKLAKNRHKGDRPGWLKDSPDALLARLWEEVRELQFAAHQTEYTPPQQADVLGEAADVANFAMMIADRVGQLALAGEEGR